MPRSKCCAGELALAARGETLELARAALYEAVELQFTWLRRSGRIAEYLLSRGFGRLAGQGGCYGVAGKELVGFTQRQIGLNLPG